MRYNDKKIGFSYFVNKKAKKKKESSFESWFEVTDPKDLLALYASVSYDGKGTTFKVSFFDGKQPRVSGDLREINEGVLKQQAEEYEAYVKEIIYLHLDLFGSVSWKGLGKKINSRYHILLSKLISEYPIPANVILKGIHPNEYRSFHHIYHLFLQEHSSMRVYEWELKDGKQLLRSSIDESGVVSSEIEKKFELFESFIDVLINLYL